MHYPTEKLSSSSYAAYFRLLFYIPLQHIGCHDPSDFLLHTITDEWEIKILFELLEKRNEQRKSTIVCSQRDPDNWKAMILNDEVSANSIMKRATKHYTIKINTR